ncbi:hypothetical protein QQX98_012437 [Neonectria punicea]|uniref:Protein kinase domain-containing protein n=1 Tax=Neonectria punicea TaxID=979145 RepID=A0ABR1GIW6_9HYPO
MKIILPFENTPEERLGIGPSQGVVYALDEDIVLKLPFQYEVTRDIKQAYCWDHSIRSLVAMEQEAAVYEALHNRPHPNFTRKLATNQSDYLFLERLEPLQEAWPNAKQRDRHRWVLELLAAVSYLEKIGFVHGDLAVRNLGVDRSNTLKLFDFGSAIPRSHPDFSHDIVRDHSNLATCLHFLLSGVDPFADAHSHARVTKIRDMLKDGRWRIAEGAEVIADIIRDGWAGRNGSMAFNDLFVQKAIIKDFSLVARIGFTTRGGIPIGKAPMNTSLLAGMRVMRRI